MFYQLSAPEMPATVFPRFMDMAKIFEKLLGYWSEPRVEYLGSAADYDPALSVEKTIKWNGSFQGTVSFRFSRKFQFWLLNRMESRAKGPLAEMDLMDEIPSTFCVQLVDRFWGREVFKMGPLTSRGSGKNPMEKTQSSCAVLVDGHRVEIRLWVD